LERSEGLRSLTAAEDDQLRCADSKYAHARRRFGPTKKTDDAVKGDMGLMAPVAELVVVEAAAG
jgi:hypothetical protein